MDLPYLAEYAKSNRASCKKCSTKIGQGELRLAVMVQSGFHDGKEPRWHHFKCFFLKARPKTHDDIANFESLRIEDQNRISEEIKSGTAAVVPTKKGKKRTAGESSALKDFLIEYSKSSRAACRGCELKIMKEEVRVSKKDFESEAGRRYGGQDMWHHLECFAKLRGELGYYESVDKMPGFKSLDKDDKAKALTALPAIKQEEVEVKKIKKEDEVDSNSKAIDAEYAAQMKLLFKFRDALSANANFKKQDLVDFLLHNKQEPKTGMENLLDQLADVMAFGALKKCPECKKGQLYFTKFGYECNGDLTEWTKCKNLVKEPARVAFKLPDWYNKDDIPTFIKKHKFKATKRVIKDVKPTVSVVKTETDGGPKIEREKPALYEMEFVITIGTERKMNDLKEEIVKLGGKVKTNPTANTMAVISTAKEVEKMSKKIVDAESLKIQVVPEEFLDQAAGNIGKIPKLIEKLSICNWGTDPELRVPKSAPAKSGASKSKSMFTKSVPSTQKFKVKGGSAVDPDSGLEDVAHVYESWKAKYTAVLGLTDIQKNKNSYYKLQLLESDNRRRFWVFRAWGRIGTTVGNNKLQEFDSIDEAKQSFHEVYLDKTGNEWHDRHNFQKRPGRMYPIDIDYGSDDANLDIVESESKLVKPVQDLIRLLFDVKQMQNLMKEYELDMEKMPLGKLSKTQLQNAFKVLTELQGLIESSGSQARFIDATNRFYTFVPHSFGVDNVPIISDPETIKQKIEMLDSLMELEVAYNLMVSSGSDHTVDAYYNQLKTDIGVLDRDSKEFKIIQDYVRNTHAQTHTNYSLEIEEVYTIKRHGEEKRYKPFKKLPNRKLLWHGSRLTNFAGILSQGLRIAPPEAPVTGYMFGKGIYFADMVSKSANYCCTSSASPTGLLMLCEVALGDMYERLQADYIEKLPKGKHSTKGVGRTQPDPKGAEVIDGVEVPIGKGKQVKNVASSLLYNEYIVYDVAQVNAKYLLKVDFKYKY